MADYDRALASLELRTASGRSLRFVLQPPARRRARRAPAGLDALYDGRIYTTGEVPTRARNWHDWLNALVWASYPQSKAALNARQYLAHRARLGDAFVTLPSARTREQDALAMLDEGALLLLTAHSDGAEARHALATGDAEALASLCHRGAVAPMVFGHALYEHLVAGDASPRGMGVVLDAPDTLPGDAAALRTMADAALAEALTDTARFTTTSAAPGVPLGAVLDAPDAQR